MLIIGLTGSIGMGKSTVAKRFIANGVPVFDADAIVHELYEGEAAQEIEAAFPGSTRDDKIYREILADILKSNTDALTRLEEIVHPMVRIKQREFLEAAAESGAEMVVLEIPLLFETGGDKHVDVTIVVTAPTIVQRSRVLSRQNMSEAKLDSLLANQMHDVEKRRRADFVVDTDRPIEDTAKEVDRLIESFHGRIGKAFAAGNCENSA